MKEVNLSNIFHSIAVKLKEDYDELAKLIPHAGESGTGKEDAVKQLLREYLPERFGVDSGFVFDAAGHCSCQTDIVIYDRFVAPKFKIVGNRYVYPCECVVAVGEVKTFLDNRQMADALKKIASVKLLDRTGYGQNKIRMGYHYKMDNEYLQPHVYHCDNIFGFVFASDSPALETVSRNFAAEISSLERWIWPNVICVLNKGIVSYYSTDRMSLVTDAFSASGVYYSDENESKFSLLKWFTLLSNDICDTHITSIPFFEYFKTKTTQNKKIPF